MGRVTQVASATHSTINEIQQNITALFQFKESASAEIEKLKNENASLTIALNTFFNNVKKGEGKKGKGTMKKQTVDKSMSSLVSESEARPSPSVTSRK